MVQTVSSLTELSETVSQCNLCKRLRKHCQKIARVKKKAYARLDYWGKPVPGFGDSKAQLLIVGLAPAAHGANRTGRMFTGDQSGLWLYRALHRAGFANQAESQGRDDGLRLKNAFITAVARCAPPDNKPLPKEIENCRIFLTRELDLLTELRAYLVLGQIALNGIWPLIGSGPRPKFQHGAQVPLHNGKLLLMSYHPSQQNTFTGRLTQPMFDRVFQNARTFLSL